MKTFTDVVQTFSKWKVQEGQNGKVTKNEITALREAYEKEVKKNTSKGIPFQLREHLTAFSSWKEENGKNAKLTESEVTRVKESLKEQNKKDFEYYVSNYKRFKEAANHKNGISVKEMKILKENFRNYINKGTKLPEIDPNFDVKRALREADMGAAPDPMAGGMPPDPMAGDPNAMGMDPMGAGAPADPMALQGAVDAAIAALQPVATGGGNALGGDPNAGMAPAMDTTAAAAGPAPGGGGMGLAEATKALISWKQQNGKGSKLSEAETEYLKERFGREKTEQEKIRERIAQRENHVRGLQEQHAAASSMRKRDSALGLPTPGENSRVGPYDQGSINNQEMGVKVPTVAQAANGFASGASKEIAPSNTWPTSAMGSEAGGDLQGANASQRGGSASKANRSGRMREEEDTDNYENNQLEEKTVTDVYVARHFEPKLDFKSIRESMQSGLLG
jgi:hypothetical protein